MNFLMIEDDIIVNIVVAEPDIAEELGLLPWYDGARIGAAYIPPMEPQQPDLTSQFHTAMLAYASTSTTIPNSYALDMPDLFPTWEAVLSAREELPAGCIINDNNQLYRVIQVVIPQSEMAPHDEGMLAIYRPINQEHTGTVDDPIPWVYGMDCYAGKYYSYNNEVYKVANGGDMIPCVWPPDTLNMWQWVIV